MTKEPREPKLDKPNPDLSLLDQVWEPEELSSALRASATRLMSDIVREAVKEAHPRLRMIKPNPRLMSDIVRAAVKEALESGPLLAELEKLHIHLKMVSRMLFQLYDELGITEERTRTPPDSE